MTFFFCYQKHTSRFTEKYTRNRIRIWDDLAKLINHEMMENIGQNNRVDPINQGKRM